MKETLFNYRIILASFALIPFIQSPVFSETASIQTGSSQRLSITLSNSMGVSTSADVTENLEVNNQANLVIEPGSTIQEEIGDEDLSVTGDFVVTPTGSSLDIQGLQAKNNYIIGDGTFFFSEMTTVDEPNPDIVTKGNASSSLVHAMTITIDQTNSSFTSSFSESF
tara:strand:- start:3343 stop:3843 length:501 start_codon:yes stop_codon:yes gene_type:complete